MDLVLLIYRIRLYLVNHAKGMRRRRLNKITTTFLNIQKYFKLKF